LFVWVVTVTWVAVATSPLFLIANAVPPDVMVATTRSLLMLDTVTALGLIPNWAGVDVRALFEESNGSVESAVPAPPAMQLSVQV